MLNRKCFYATNSFSIWKIVFWSKILVVSKNDSLSWVINPNFLIQKKLSISFDEKINVFLIRDKYFLDMKIIIRIRKTLVTKKFLKSIIESKTISFIQKTIIRLKKLCLTQIDHWTNFENSIFAEKIEIMKQFLNFIKILFLKNFKLKKIF